MEQIEAIVTADVHGYMHVPVPTQWIGKPLRIRVEVEDMDAGPADRERRRAAAFEAMERLAARGGLGIDDPVAWQREIRKDRPLPGRE